MNMNGLMMNEYELINIALLLSKADDFSEWVIN